VGSHPLAAEVADCLAGTAVPCRALVDVTERFAAVAYLKDAQLLTEVMFHTAATAAASGRLAEFVKICTLDKKLNMSTARMPGGVAQPQQSCTIATQ
jgi:alpha-D-ribose 1-methylphosphonate 5-triphosphate synthase subunit PhnH